MSEPVKVDNNGRRIHDQETRKMLESMGFATRSKIWELDKDKIKIICDLTKKKVDGLKVLTQKELGIAKMVLGSRLSKIKDPSERAMMLKTMEAISNAEKVLKEAKTKGDGVQPPGFGRDKNQEIQKVDQGKDYKKEEVEKAIDALEGRSKDRVRNNEQTRSNNPFELNR